MKKFNSAKYAALLAEGLTEAELPLSDRSNKWWDMFWYYVAVDEAEKVRDKWWDGVWSYYGRQEAERLRERV